jgi:hypothetical protein
MKRFIGLSTTLTAGFVRYYALSLVFSAKRVPTLIDLRPLHLKTAKYQFYRHINYVLENTACLLIRLDPFPSAEFVTSRQNFDTPRNCGASHRFDVTAASSGDLLPCYPHAIIIPQPQQPFFRSKAPELVFSVIYLRGSLAPSAFPSTNSRLRFPPLINHEKTALSRQSL